MNTAIIILVAVIALHLSLAATTKSESDDNKYLKYGTIVLLGESGAGKSTLAQILTGTMFCFNICDYNCSEINNVN